jgi:hypothetical protein
MEECETHLLGAGKAYPRPIDQAGHYGRLGDIARVVAPYTEADLNAIIVQGLIYVGNVVGRRAYYVAGVATRHHPNEFAVVVGKSAKARKGTSLRDVQEVLGSLDPTWNAGRVATSLSSGEGLVNLVRDPIDAEQVGVSDKRRLILVPEFSSMFKVAVRTGNNLTEFVCLAWDGENLQILTKNPMVATEPHISILGHMTQAALSESMKGANQTYLYNGLMNRFLFVCAQRSQKKALLTDGERERLTSELDELKKRILPVGEFLKTLDGVRFDFDEEARRAFVPWYRDLEDGEDLLGAVTARAEAHVCRLAMIEAVLDKSTVIRLEHLNAALAIWRYCRESAEYVFSQILSQPTGVANMASTIMKALDLLPDGLSKSEIYRDVFGSNKSSDLIDQALLRLEQEGLAGSVKDPGSRQPERWLKAKVLLELAPLAA